MPRARAVIPLAEVRDAVLTRCASLADRDGPVGCYRSAPGRRPDLYAALDVALLRGIMGEDLQRTLSPADRAAWAAHINSFARHDHERGGDGVYDDRLGHAPLHANGMVIGALGLLGARQAYPVTLYAPFAAADDVAGWLDGLDWVRQWSGSHAFWGGMHCYSFSRHCTPAWRDAVFAWLDREVDPVSGWWRRGVTPADRHQSLGGAAHLLPIYEHHGRAFPAPERILDSTLALQLPSGRWLDGSPTPPLHYLELDALYVFRAMRAQAPGHRAGDIDAALDRYIDLVAATWNGQRDRLLSGHPHTLLAVVGTFGLLQQLRPEQFPDAVAWTDIFTDRKLYRTDQVEV